MKVQIQKKLKNYLVHWVSIRTKQVYFKVSFTQSFQMSKLKAPRILHKDFNSCQIHAHFSLRHFAIKVALHKDSVARMIEVIILQHDMEAGRTQLCLSIKTLLYYCTCILVHEHSSISLDHLLDSVKCNENLVELIA